MTERGERILGIVMTIILVPPLFLGIIMLLGMMIEGIGQHKAEHDRCLKHATNGYDIRNCK